MKPQTKRILGIGILLIIIAWFVYYLINHLGEFKQLSFVSPLNLIFLIGLFLIHLTFNGIIFINLVKPFKIKLNLKEGFGLAVISSFYNLIFPARGGAVARATYLKKKHNFSISYFLSTLAGLYVIVFLVNSFIGLIMVLILYLIYDIFNIIVFLVFLFLFLFLSSIVVFSPKLKEKTGIFGSIIKMINGWNQIKSNKGLILIISLITSIQFFILSFMSYLEFRTFGINMPLIKVMLVAIVSTLSLLISITPGALGIKEAFIVFSSKVIGVTTTQAIAVSLLDRVIFMLVLFILGPVFSVILLKHKPLLIQETQQKIQQEKNEGKT